jgi:hypothetical protein
VQLPHLGQVGDGEQRAGFDQLQEPYAQHKEISDEQMAEISDEQMADFFFSRLYGPQKWPKSLIP